MARKILITSGKGGVGKTTICVNIATQISKMGYSVLIVDADMGLNNLDVVMGVEGKIVYDIYDIAMGRCRVTQAVIDDYYNDNLHILPASKDLKSLSLGINTLSNIITELDGVYDYIFIDSPAGIEKGFVRTLDITKEAIIVTTPHISAIRDADKVSSILKSVGFDMISVVVNRARGDLILSGESISNEFIKDFLCLDIIGVVPEDDEINNQLLIGGDINQYSPAFVSFKKISKSIVTGKVSLYDCTKKYRGFIGSIKRRLRKII